MHLRELVSLPALACQRAETHADEVALTVIEGRKTLTWETLYSRSRAWASMLHRLGVRKGDVVATMLAAGDEAAISWTGTAEIGAIEAPINHAFTGDWLLRALETTRPKLAVIDKRFAESWEPIVRELGLRVLTTADSALTGFMRVDDLLADSNNEAPSVDGRLDDPACIILTSGTTGRSKGVIVPWGRCLGTVRLGENMDPDATGVYYNPFPPFHWSARGPIYRAANRGTAMVSRERFRTSTWLDDIRDFGCTDTLVIGAMVSFLMNSPEREDDADNPLRVCTGGPLAVNIENFAARFGIDRVVATYGMSEIVNVFMTPPGETVTVRTHQSVGKESGFPVRIVKDGGAISDIGEVGELQVGGDRSSLNLGYINNPEATQDAWTPDGWFKTGDLFRRDEDGYYYFVDRLKDSLRRRGENISSAEVEAVALQHPLIQSCAVIAVPSEFSEDEVMIFAVPEDESDLAPEELLDFMRNKIPGFALPRFVEFVTELPHTPTMKIQKVELRDRGRGPATWDGLQKAFVGG
ncbi:AMP-binding protein [Micrococcaceae bacterium Sec5.1]